ncbi:MAG TPA: CDP-alcohol phosphatidyltransferase family protein [Candidatus Obscuribacterales bacterium]
MINVPNAITIGRVILALGTVALCFSRQDNVLWMAFGLTIVVIWADALDGYFARKLNQATKLGGVLDIAGDRVVELTYWIVYAVLNWVPVWIPLLFLVRGNFVDAIRAQASEQGYTAFGSKTMMQSAVGKFIVSSNFMRFSYAVVKAVAFCLLIAGNTSQGKVTIVPTVAIYCAYIAAAICLLRGVPVLVEARGILK